MLTSLKKINIERYNNNANKNKTKNTSTGDALVFLDEDEQEVKAMLVEDLKGYYDVVFLQVNSGMSEYVSKGIMVGKRYI